LFQELIEGRETREGGGGGRDEEEKEEKEGGGLDIIRSLF
jgi:hypothetical protein